MLCKGAFYSKVYIATVQTKGRPLMMTFTSTWGYMGSSLLQPITYNKCNVLCICWRKKYTLYNRQFLLVFLVEKLIIVNLHKVSVNSGSPEGALGII